MKLVVPSGCWLNVVGVLRDRPHDRERVAYLDGPRPANGIGVVTTVTVPAANVRAGNFHVSADQMSRAGQHLRALGLMRLAQAHSHPSGWTGHSASDDEQAFSQRDGAISIVVPHFAGCAPGVGDCRVHVRDQHGWHDLGPADGGRVVQIVPSLIDLRS